MRGAPLPIALPLLSITNTVRDVEPAQANPEMFLFCGGSFRMQAQQTCNSGNWAMTPYGPAFNAIANANANANENANDCSIYFSLLW